MHVTIAGLYDLFISGSYVLINTPYHRDYFSIHFPHRFDSRHQVHNRSDGRSCTYHLFIHPAPSSSTYPTFYTHVNFYFSKTSRSVTILSALLSKIRNLVCPYFSFCLIPQKHSSRSPCDLGFQSIVFAYLFFLQLITV